MDINYTVTRKRPRNFNNDNNKTKKKRTRNSKITFRNTNTVIDLRNNDDAVEARKSIHVDKISRDSPDIEHILRKRTDHKKYRKNLLQKLKNKGTLFNKN